MEKMNVEKIYGLTPMQEGMLYHKLIDTDSTEYVIQSAFKYKDVLNAELVKQSLAILAVKHEVLRTSLIVTEDGPFQVILRDRYVELNITKMGTDEEIELAKQSDILRGFDLKEDSLLRVSIICKGAEESIVLWTMHHIITDGWCTSLLFGDFLDNYKKLLNGEDYDTLMREVETARSTTGSYDEYIRLLEQKNKESGLKYWEKLLEGYFEPALVAPTQTEETGNEVEKLSIRIDKDVSEKLRVLAQKEKITLNNIAEVAWGIVLQKYSGTEDVVFGKVVTGRDVAIEGAERMVGLFINTVPLRIKSEENTTIRDLLQYVHNQGIESSEHDYCSLAEVQSKSALGRHLFNTLFVYENYYVDERMFEVVGEEQLSSSIIALGNRGQTNYGLSVTARYIDCLSFDLMFDPRVYGRIDAELILKRIEMAISEIAANPDKYIVEIVLITDDEKEQLLYKFNDTYADYPRDKTIHQLFEEQVERIPGNVALDFGDESMTYSELNSRSNQLAWRLRSKGVKADSIVGLMVERSFEMIIGILGILKAGGAYLPIDPEYPENRIKFMLEDSATNILLTQSGLRGKVAFAGDVLELDSGMMYDNMDEDNPENISCVKDLAYVIYTSGSTGVPKGVMVEHGSVVNLLYDLNTCYPMEKGDAYLLKTSYTFDVSVSELFGWIVAGEKLVILPAGYERMPEEIVETIYDKAISHINFVPSMLTVFFTEVGKSNVARKMRSLKYIISAGEPLKKEMICDFYKHFKNARLENKYGPTEATVYNTKYRTIVEEKYNTVPIGKPISNTQTYIVNDGQICGINIPGELCIGGEGLARGYLNRPELTAEKFVENPFIPGERMYRTGDLARWLPDGNIEFLGRIDDQVKIRGFRIELGEIESQLLAFAGMKEAIVLVREDEGGDKYLCAYVVSEREISVKELREHLSGSLPEYMVPSFFVQLDAIPLNANGKIDRKALPDPDDALDSGTEYEAPRNRTEEILSEIWSEVLKVERVGIHDNFFELGGNSIKLIKFISKAHQEGIEFKIKDAFDNPTIAGLIMSIGKDVPKIVVRTEKDYEKYRTLLSTNQINKDVTNKKNSVGNILITGATGFLGAHILDEYIKNEDGIAYCLVRGENLEESKKKLDIKLDFYFPGRYKGNRRIVVINGDITQRVECDSEIDMVIHSAANVKHYGLYDELYYTNVQGVKNVVDFAKCRQANMIHISTNSVFDVHVDYQSGNLSEVVLCENSVFLSDKTENMYIRSKLEAETIVMDAMLDGLKANIIRVGNLTNRYEDAKFQPNFQDNAFLKRAKALLELDELSDRFLALPMELSPVDCVSNAILKIAQHFNELNTIFHVNHCEPILGDRVFKALKALKVRRRINNDNEDDFLRKISNQQKRDNFFEAFIPEISEADIQPKVASVKVDNMITTWYLRKLGFTWPNIDVKYLKKYIEYFIEIGYFDL